MVCADGKDGVSSQSEPNEDDLRRTKSPPDVGVSVQGSSSNNRHQPEMISAAQEPACLRLTKSLSGGDLSQTRTRGVSDRRSTPAAGLPTAAIAVPTTEPSCRMFSPFPRQHFNRRRVDNAIRLGLYTVDDTTTGPHKATAARPDGRYPHS